MYDTHTHSCMTSAYQHVQTPAITGTTTTSTAAVLTKDLVHVKKKLAHGTILSPLWRAPFASATAAAAAAAALLLLLLFAAAVACVIGRGSPPLLALPLPELPLPKFAALRAPAWALYFLRSLKHFCATQVSCCCCYSSHCCSCGCWSLLLLLTMSCM
jgi:hypothetical protein